MDKLFLLEGNLAKIYGELSAMDKRVFGESVVEKKPKGIAIMVSGKLAGYGLYTADKMRPHTAYMYSLAIDGKYRNKGYGKLIVDRLVSLIKRKTGFKFLMSGYKKKDKLGPFYRKCMFTETADDYYRSPVPGVVRLIMKL